MKTHWTAALIALLAGVFTAGEAASQNFLASRLALELRGGLAVPLGEFTEADPGIGAEPGPHIGAAALWRFTPGIAVHLGYSRSSFGCERCGRAGLDDQVVDAGLDAGLHFRLPLQLVGVAPWVSVAGVFHELVFSGEGSTLSSGYAPGFRLGAGVAVPIAGAFALKPGVSYSSYSAELALGPFPDQTVDVSHLAVELGLAYHF